MGKRPRTSIVGGIDAGLTLYNTTKLRSMNSDMKGLIQAQNKIRLEQENTQRAIIDSTNIVLGGIKNVAELQVATMNGLVELDNKLDILSSIAWDLKGYLERKEEKQRWLGNLKLIVIRIEEELEKIQAYSENYKEYAIVQIENLRALINNHDVKVEHFADLRVDEIKWVKGVLESVERTHSEYNTSLGD